MLDPMATAHQPDKLERELIRLLGEVRLLTTPDAPLAWGCDGFTAHKFRPRAGVLPESTSEIQVIVRRLHATDVAFVPRGAGTCLSGGPTVGRIR